MIGVSSEPFVTKDLKDEKSKIKEGLRQTFCKIP